MASSLSAKVLAAGLVGAAFLAGTCVHCGATEPGIPTLDAGGEVAALDAPGIIDQSAPVIDASDGDTTQSYDSGKVGACPVEPGWHVVPTQGPACIMLAPDDLHASIPDPKWIPCTNGRVGCMELERIGPATQDIYPRRVSHVGRALGKSMLSLDWLRAQGGKGPCYRNVLLDVSGANARIVQAWDGTYIKADGAVCQVELIDSKGEPGTLFRTTTTTAISVGVDFDPSKVVAYPHPEDGNHAYASATVLATQNAAKGEAYRMPFGSNQAVTIRTPVGLSPLIMEMVEGNDVFAHSNAGTSGWMEWYRTDTDGQARLVLTRPSAHVFHLRSDGANLFWLEGSGNPGSFWPQPTLEAWTSPYSSDLAAVRANARKLADVSGLYDFVNAASAFSGYYVFAGDPVGAVTIVRATDGARQLIDSGLNRRTIAPVNLTDSEVWVHYSKINSTEAGIARIQLAPWP